MLPGVVAVAAGMSLGLIRWRLNPRHGATVLASVVLGTVAVALAVVVTIAGGFLISVPVVTAVLEACSLGPSGHVVGWTAGVPAMIATAWILLRIRTVVATHRWAASGSSGRGFVLLDSEEPIAYAAPGDPGSIVVSSGMFDVLGPDERSVLLAHEAAHLELGHHRHLMIADLGLAVLPPLRPLVDQLRLAVERAADEAAVQEVDGDRNLVAAAIARAAVAKSTYRPATAGFLGATAPLRVEALIGSPPRRALLVLGAIVAGLGIAGNAGALAVQGHHLATAIRHVCGA